MRGDKSAMNSVGENHVFVQMHEQLAMYIARHRSWASSKRATWLASVAQGQVLRTHEISEARQRQQESGGGGEGHAGSASAAVNSRDVLKRKRE